ncbi:hypothetical protein GOP47_0019409 [Adiantum capillus-veneris]|uniref:SprT-like domain-containing protein n=1 Tax=Adiantum capillus-veneris TaxID=13818 RepID=A0A9D4UB00_ADICA|nr:hypothetical protein GOP47_0019409 [Adiantum capillus-veneris]
MEEEGGVRTELDAADLLDPNPDILGLFCHYNDLYFDNKLHACTVEWSTSRMTLCAGICKYGAASCAIRLSEPLLKFRSSLEVKETLLHEMIHAYLWLTNNNQDHDDHGPSFQKMMQAINDSQSVDHQRPAGGYHITVYHKFSDEVNSYRKHHWKCIRCGNLVKRASNRAPSQADCYQKIGGGNVCNNERCHWHWHQQLCGGEYEKIAEPEGYRDRRFRARKSGVKVKESKMSSKADVDKQTPQKQKVAVDNLGTKKTKGREDDESCQLPKNASLEMYFAYKSKLNDREQPMTATEIEDHCQLHEHISSEEDIGVSKKRGRKYKGDDSDGDFFCPAVYGKPALALSKRQEAANSLERITVQSNECTVIIGWKGWYAFEGEEDETDTKALKNKRSQRRMFERASSQVVNISDPVIRADSPGAPDLIQDPDKEMVGSGEGKAVGKNALSPVALYVSDSAVTNVVGVTDAIPRQVLPVDDYSSSIEVDLCAASHAENVDSVMLGHNKHLAKGDLNIKEVSKSTLGPEDSYNGVSVSAEQTTLIDHVDCATMIPCNMQGSLPISLNENDKGMMNSQEILEAEEITMVEVSEIKVVRKGRSKRRREDPGRSSVMLSKAGKHLL